MVYLSTLYIMYVVFTKKGPATYFNFEVGFGSALLYIIFCSHQIGLCSPYWTVADGDVNFIGRLIEREFWCWYITIM
jgi:hypothetical protein